MHTMISVVIPVLNEEVLLPDCLTSLQNQDYLGEYELLVVDNGSTDRSIDIAREFGVKVVTSPVSKNVFYARDVGARLSLGEIVAQADADTVYPKDWLTRISQLFLLDPSAVAVAGTFGYRQSTRWGGAETLFRNFANVASTTLRGRPYIVSGANFAFRKEAFLRIHGYNVESYAPDQYGIATSLSKIGKVLYDKKLLVATSSRRLHKSTFSMMYSVWTNFCVVLKYSFTKGVTPRVKLNLISIPLVLAFVIYGYFIPSSDVFGNVYSKGDVSAKVVALTFDDGPNEPYTSQILDILHAYKINATFFTIGKNVELYPETAKRIIADGNVLGNHSFSHKANHAVLPGGDHDIELAQEAILKTVGVLPHLYRPPHGKKTPWELEYLQDKGLVEVNWSVSTNELHVESSQLLAQRIVKKVKPGSIILLHDGYGNDHDTPQANKSLEVKALPRIIKSLQEQGYQFVTVSQLLHIPAYDSITL